MFDLVNYARGRRLRLRNLHDGQSCPPARIREKSERLAYLGDDDRFDAIVGRDGYVAMDQDRLLMFMHFRSRRGQTCGMRQLAQAGVTIDQDGDLEVWGHAPVEAMAWILDIIRVSKLHPGNPNPDLSGLERHRGGDSSRTYGPHSALEATQAAQVGSGDAPAGKQALSGQLHEEV